MRPLTAHRQRDHRVRLEWGREGAALLAAECAVVVIVDVLSFSTAVDVAVGRGASVLPLATRDADAAARHGAVLASSRRGVAPSLSPASLRGLAAGTRLALPSPNGATLTASAARATESGGAGRPRDDEAPAGPSAQGAPHVLVGCLRNAAAVAAAAAAVDGPIGLVPAGERWPDDTMRVAVEDLLGVGAIAAHLSDRSPEAELAAATFEAARPRLAALLHACASGLELIETGFTDDVALAADLDVSGAVPTLRDGLLAPG